MSRLLRRLLILALLLAVCLWWWRRGTQELPRFRLAPVNRGPLWATISASGTLAPEELVDVGAQVAGKIDRLGPDPQNEQRTIDYGSHVAEGTVLAQIDDALFKTQVSQARANLLRAEAEVLQLRARLYQQERSWTRAQDLSKKGAITEADFDAAQAEFESAKAALAIGEAAVSQARASLDQVEINLGYTTIKSPVAGVIIDRRVNVGQTVVASLNAPSLFLIAKDLRRMQVWAAVNEADVGQIRLRQNVRFTVDAYPDETFTGQVSQIRLNATMTQNVVTYTVVVSTDNAGGKLLPYLTANAQFEVAHRPDALLVPNAALRYRPAPERIEPRFRTPEGEAGLLNPEPSAPAAPTTAATPPSTPPAETNRTDDRAAASHTASRPQKGTVWLPVGKPPRYVRPVMVTLGLADATHTEITAGELSAGDTLVLAELSGEEGPDSSGSPFMPQMMPRRRTP